MFNMNNTPMVQLNDYKGVKLYAKLECNNLTGSIKIRAVDNMLKAAFNKGSIKEGTLVVEPTSGNTGIALACLVKKYGLEAIIVMPENMSKERVEFIERYGAKVILTSAEKGMKGSIDKANEILSKEKNCYMLDQFRNFDNSNAHFLSTAGEIFLQVKNIDWIVSPVGTGGTIMGIKKYIDTNCLKTKVCAVEPKESPMLTKGYAGSHKIQGIGANFVPEILDVRLLDEIVLAESDMSIKMAKYLFDEYSIPSGISGGAAYLGAKHLIDKENNANLSSVVIIIPDNRDRYMQGDLA